MVAIGGLAMGGTDGEIASGSRVLDGGMRGRLALPVLLCLAACGMREPPVAEAPALLREVLAVDGFQATLPSTDAPDWYVLPERRGGDMVERRAVRDLGERHRVTASIVARQALSPATARTVFDERVLDAPAEALPGLYEDELAGTLGAIEQSAREPGSGRRVVAARAGARPAQAAAGATCVELTQRMEAPTTPTDEPAVRFRETTYTCFHPERRGSMAALVYAEEWYGTIGEAINTFNTEAAAFLDSLEFN